MISAPSFFASIFDQSDDNEYSEVYVFDVRVVILLVMLILSSALISLSLLASLKISVNRATHLIFIFHFSGYVYLTHFCIVDFISS